RGGMDGGVEAGAARHHEGGGDAGGDVADHRRLSEEARDAAGAERGGGDDDDDQHAHARIVQCAHQSRPMPPLLRLARSRDIAAEVAERLVSAEEDVIAASSGMAAAIAAELLARKPNGVAGVRLQTLNDLARRIVKDAGEYPRGG